MIRLIATDLDGTLLNDKKELPQEIFGLVEQLYDREILFVPASGRQYANLERMFFPVKDKVVFLCENGALVRYRGRTLLLNPIRGVLLKSALDEIRAIPGLYPVLCGTDCAYIEDDYPPFRDYATAAYTNCETLDDLDRVIGREDVCKIAVYDSVSAADHCIKLLPQRLPLLRTILSGTDWCDVSDPASNKGEAMRFLRRFFGLNRDECVAFGDHMNDYEMLLECGRAYVTENAYPPLKKIIPRTIPSNKEGGVLLKLKEILEKGE